MSPLRTALGRVSGYGATFAVTAVANLAVIPMVIRAFGDSGWASIALAQSIGTVAWAVISYGWAVNGPAVIALSAPENRREIFLDSVVARLALAIPVLTATAAGTAVLAHAERPAAVLVALATAVTGLGAQWMFIGLQSPRGLFLLDALPRALGIAGGGLAVLAGAPAPLLGLVQLMGGVVAAAGGTAVLARRLPRTVPFRASASRIRRALIEQFPGFATTIVSSLYLQLPVVFVVGLTPPAGPLYALADRVEKYASAALGPIYQALQGWVPSGGAQMLAQRARRGALISLGISAVAFVGYVLLSQPVGRLLGGGTLGFGWDFALATGVILAASLVSQGVGLACLAALGHTRDVALSAVVGALIGVPLAVVGTLTWPGLGAAWAVAISEVGVTAYQLFALRRALRRLAPTMAEAL
jgi:O-antigen/teichoic acid export membrane protein